MHNSPRWLWLVRAGLLILPVSPLALFFPVTTVVLAALAVTSQFVRRRPWHGALLAAPSAAVVGVLVAQIAAGLLCEKTLTLIFLGVAVASAVPLRRRLLFVASPLAVALLVVNITWYSGIDENAGARLAAQPGVSTVFEYRTGKDLAGHSANRARALAPLPDGSLALGVRGGDSAVLRLNNKQVTPLGGGHFSTDNLVPLNDGLIVGDIRASRLFRLAGPPWRVAAQANTHPDQIGILRLDGPWLYTISANRRAIQAFAAADFARGRTYPVDHLCSDLCACDGNLFAATFVGGKVLAIDSASGATRWTIGTGSLLQQNLATSEDAVYVTSFLPGLVARLDRRTGAYQAVRRVGPGWRYCAFDTPTRTLLVSDYLAGQIVVLDGLTLGERARVTVGRRPRWLEPDGRGAWLVVSAAGGYRLEPARILAGPLLSKTTF